MNQLLQGIAAASWVLSATPGLASINILSERIANEQAGARFAFTNVPRPSRTDAATSATLSIVAGESDSNGGSLRVLQDGRLPNDADQPAANFFFEAGTAGGRILLDLGKPIEIKQINTYSWHPSTRGPQVYKLFASDGSPSGFKQRPEAKEAPEQCGWKVVANVDTRPAQGDSGGQYGVSVTDSAGSLGKYQFLLFAIARTEDADPFGNTFYSEIDVLDQQAPPVSNLANEQKTEPAVDIILTGAGHEITLDTTETPDLTEWALARLVPMAREWYPKIVELLPSEGFEAPKKLSIVIDEDMRGVASTSGTRIRCAAGWFRRNLEGEAVGAVFHELVHVVQQYGQARRANPEGGRSRAPGWLTEGIPDYLRWFIYEPQTRGAEITRTNISRARYDASYRISANFLNWATQKYSKDLVKVLNAAIREGKYSEEIWKTQTEHSLEELGAEWKKAAEDKIAAQSGVGAQE